VGGFAHARALRHRPPTGEFVRARMSRLLPPAVAMLTVWAVLAATLDVSGLAAGELAAGLHRITVPLWFLGVYLLIVLAAPTMMRLHLRFGLWPVVGTLAVAAAAVDLVALGAGVALVGYANMLFVWLAVHQMGYGYADGTLLRGGRRLAAALAVGGLGATVALVFGTSVYPVLMVGLPVNETANSSPATLALVTQSLFLIGVALLLRVWLLVLPGWLTACALICAGLVVLCRRFERPRPPAAVRTGAAVTGVVAAALGLFAVSETGLDGLVSWRAGTAAGAAPLPASVALALVALGVLLLRGRRRSVRLAAEHSR
jgi:hypothetical protein